MAVRIVALLRHARSRANDYMSKILNGGDSQLILHLQAESIGNPDNPKLTDLGISQAIQVGQPFRELIEEIRNNKSVSYFCSTLDRAKHTARLALPEVDWRYDDRLRERLWNGIEEYDQSMPVVEYFNACIERSRTVDLSPAPGGESAIQKYADVESFFCQAFEEAEQEILVIVCHGEWMRLAKIHLLGLGIESWPIVCQIPVLNCQAEAYSMGHPCQPSLEVARGRFDHQRIIYPPNNLNFASTDWIPVKR